jgi:hypothetical protein
MDAINARVRAYEKRLIEDLPAYAFKYEEGDRYISRRYREDIDQKCDAFRIRLMEEVINRIERAAAPASPAEESEISSSSDEDSQEE